jgi:hypothetical protein
MVRGFLGYDASLMLDVVVCALVLVVPALSWSIYQVRVRRRFTLHRNSQLILAGVLLATVLLFEIDMRLQGGWEQIVNRDPANARLSGDALRQVRTMLYVHLFFAISTPILWGVTIALALRRFPNPPRPGPHSTVHKRLGWLSVMDLVLTSVTGLVFYYLAFIRTTTP